MKRLLTLIITNMAMLSLFAQKNLTQLSNLNYPDATLAGIWAYVDSANNEYALVGTSEGLSIVDVTQPASPVEVQLIPPIIAGNWQNLWRELKTFGHYAYVVSEGGGGVQIIDLRNLPLNVNSKVWTGNGSISGLLNKFHTVQIVDSIAYFYGGDYSSGGCVMAKLNDPWNPDYIGEYEGNYIHDGMVRNDTMWAAEIYAGQFEVIDVTDKSNPVVLASQQTPYMFNHNTWLSDDSRFLFTTDELDSAYMACYDVSDLSNIQLKDLYRTTNTPGGEVHNIYTKKNSQYLVGACYGSRVVIIDAYRPNNLIEVADFTTGDYLCWDVYAELPSGNIIASDDNSGLYVFSPVYTRACYLEGTVKDSVNNINLINVKVELIDHSVTRVTDITSLSGSYKTGYVDSGYYDVRFTLSGCFSKTISNVHLQKGLVTNLNVKLRCPFLGFQKNEQNSETVFFLSQSGNRHAIHYALRNNSSNAFISITDVLGKEIKTFLCSTDKGEIELTNNFPSGIYFVRLNDKNFQKTLKMTVRE